MDTNENNMQGRASYTEEERRELIEEFHISGIKQAAFCREWNINPKTLARWLRIERQDKEVSFCEVELPVNASREIAGQRKEAMRTFHRTVEWSIEAPFAIYDFNSPLNRRVKISPEGIGSARR